MRGSDDIPRRFAFVCSECGETHEGSPSFTQPEPAYVAAVPDRERRTRVQLTSDLCIIAPPSGAPESETVYCIRATLDVPIHGAAEPFTWGVWVTQSEASFERYVETYSDDQSHDGSFGYLAVTMAEYRRTAPGEFENLGCDVYWGGPGVRPAVIVHECQHPLFFDQRDGISWERAAEIAEAVMHGTR